MTRPSFNELYLGFLKVDVKKSIITSKTGFQNESAETDGFFQTDTHTHTQCLIMSTPCADSSQSPALSQACTELIWSESQFLFRLEDVSNCSFNPSFFLFLEGFWMLLGESRSYSPTGGLQYQIDRKRKRGKGVEGGRGLWWSHSERWIFVWQFIMPLCLK